MTLIHSSFETKTGPATRNQDRPDTHPARRSGILGSLHLSPSALMLANVLLVLVHMAPPAAGQAGAIDTGFGTNGSIVLPIDLGDDLLDIPTAIVRQPNGALVIGGYASTDVDGSDFVILRLDAHGNLDPDFGTGGRRVIGLNLGGGNDDQLEGLGLRPDGRIVAGGYADTATGALEGVVVQLLADGSNDPNFGTGGVARIPFVGASNDGFFESLLVQPDGKILLIGSTLLNPPDFDMVVVRLHADGSLDTTFGVDGRTTIFFDLGGANRDFGWAAALQADGAIVVAGSVDISANSSHIGVVRLLPNGQFDPAFDGDGRTTISAGVTDGVNLPLDVSLQVDGKILVAGLAPAAVQTTVSFVLRLLPNGSPDTTFAGSGTMRLSFGGRSDFARSVSTLADGKIVVGSAVEDAQSNFEFGLGRLLPNGSLDTSFAGGGTTTFGFDEGGTDGDAVEDMVVRPDGRVVLVGTVERTTFGDHDFGVAQFLNDVAGPPLFSDAFETGDTSVWTRTVP